MEGAAGYTSLAPSTVSVVHNLSKLAPKRLAVMHGSSFEGDGGAALAGLANHYAARFQAAMR